MKTTELSMDQTRPKPGIQQCFACCGACLGSINCFVTSAAARAPTEHKSGPFMPVLHLSAVLGHQWGRYRQKNTLRSSNKCAPGVTWSRTSGSARCSCLALESAGPPVFDSMASDEAAADMPSARSPQIDRLFAGAMPKEEIGGSAFLKVAYHTSPALLPEIGGPGCSHHHSTDLVAVITSWSTPVPAFQTLTGYAKM